MFSKPLPDFKIQDTYPICVSYISNNAVKKYMESMSSNVYSQSDKYLDLIKSSDLENLDIPVCFMITRDSTGKKIENCNNHWFIKLYKYYFSKSNPKYASANQFYNRIKLDGVSLSVNYNKRCCYCNNHKIEVLDHFLPESRYNFLAVNPINLVPSCEECNDNKLAYSPSATNPVLVHPYFDVIDDVKWLEVKIVDRLVTTDLSNCKKYNYTFEYFVKDVIEECSIDIVRIKKTFGLLKINNNIVFEAESFFNTELYYELTDLDELGGLSDLELAQHFKRKSRALNKQGYGLNHWKVSLYQMLSEVTDFSYLKENPL